MTRVPNPSIDGRYHYRPIIEAETPYCSEEVRTTAYYEPPSSAKEATQYFITSLYSASLSYVHVPRALTGFSVNPDPGDSKIIWSSQASHPLCEIEGYTCYFAPQAHTHSPQLTYSGFCKGCYREWGDFRFPCSFARIGKLSDQDFVWIMTQTMVSLRELGFVGCA
jgi:hypothetical protein